jgi:hypothetical protein
MALNLGEREGDRRSRKNPEVDNDQEMLSYRDVQRHRFTQTPPALKRQRVHRFGFCRRLSQWLYPRTSLMCNL